MSTEKKAQINRQSFFKYMTADAAIKTLITGSLRWSSPLMFNDIFDVPKEIAFNIAPLDILNSIHRAIIRLIKNHELDTSNMQPNIQSIVKALRNPPQEVVVEDALNEVFKEVGQTDLSRKPLDALAKEWREMLPTLRILCLTQSPHHIAMWHHYGGNYTGAVLEFGNIQENSQLLRAKPIHYPNYKSGVFTIDDWGQMLLLNPKALAEEILDKTTHSKSPDWSYENEWRIVDFSRDSKELWEHINFNPKELKSVYLGPSVKAIDKQIIIGIAKRYPNATVLQTHVTPTRDLYFNPE